MSENVMEEQAERNRVGLQGGAVLQTPVRPVGAVFMGQPGATGSRGNGLRWPE